MKLNMIENFRILCALPVFKKMLIFILIEFLLLLCGYYCFLRQPYLNYIACKRNHSDLHLQIQQGLSAIKSAQHSLFASQGFLQLLPGQSSKKHDLDERLLDIIALIKSSDLIAEKIVPLKDKSSSDLCVPLQLRTIRQPDSAYVKVYADEQVGNNLENTSSTNTNVNNTGKIPFAIIVTGTYFDILKFLQNLHSYRPTNFFKNVLLKEKQSGESNLSLSAIICEQ
jgi:Tfp pilus assembly protein PilO